MDVRERLNTATIYSKWNKAQLADWLIAHGTAYPNRAGLLKWSKDDLVNSVTDRVLEAPAYRRDVCSTRGDTLWLGVGDPEEGYCSGSGSHAVTA